MIKDLDRLIKLTNDTLILQGGDDVSTTFKIEYIINTMDHCFELKEEGDYFTIEQLSMNVCKVLDIMNDEEFEELIKELNKNIKYYQDIDTLNQWYEIIKEERR